MNERRRWAWAHASIWPTPARGLLDALASTDADDETLHCAVAQINEARDTLAAAPIAKGRSRLLDGPLMGLGTLSELGHFTARLHGMAPPIDMLLGSECVEATVAYGPAHEGGPGVLHGGFIAATFDELLAVIRSRAFSAIVLGDSEVRIRHYHAEIEKYLGRR